MSSDLALPTIIELLDAFGAEVRASRFPLADVHRGAVYDIAAGVGAILWARMAERDRDLFRVCYFSGATDTDLDARIAAFNGPSRVQSTRGVGTAILRRTSASGGAGTVLEGTRISLTGAGTLRPRVYAVAADTSVNAADLAVTVAIESEEYGEGASVDTGDLATPQMHVVDALWDASWTVDRIVCADGTERESDADYLARYRQDKIDRRMGYATAITDACKAAGAGQVALFESDHILPDTGINRCFVGDAGFESTDDLLRACRVAVDSARVLGCDLTVFGMTRTLCTFDITLYMWDDPGRYNQDAIRVEATNAVLRYFDGGSNPYVYRFDGIRGELARSVPDMQAAALNSGPSDTTISSVLASAVLERLYATAGSITIRLEGPQ